MRHFLIVSLLILAACETPEDVAYCQRLGVNPQHAEYGRCMDYFHAQDAAFRADLVSCDAEADVTYPPTLYDTGRTAWADGGFWAGRYQPSQTIFIEPDYQHNAQVDALRQRIITPCMQSKGWKSGDSWEAGRMAPQPRQKPANAPLPWAK
jgi:hypothetical protein